VADRKREAAKRRGERERGVGIDPADAAARWLEEHDQAPAPEPPKSLGKSKALHRWRQQQGR
jgi:hypothetical protein